MKEVTRYETIDGKLFTYEDDAKEWETKLGQVEDANFQLNSGVNLYTVLKTAGFYPSSLEEHKDILEKMTKDTKLIISHWQCKENPGYSPVRIENDNSIYVWGDAGSWSGSYGSKVGLSDLCRYMKDTLKVLEAREQYAAQPDGFDI